MSVPEVRRLLHALGTPPEEQRRCVHWSHFRRQHQATAKHLHTLRHARQTPGLPEQLPAPVLLAGVPALTDAHWQQLLPLFPPQKSQRGRRAADYRLMVEAVLWIARTASSWRELPERFGPWETVVYHYARWGKKGLWERILQVLFPHEVLPGPAP